MVKLKETMSCGAHPVIFNKKVCLIEHEPERIFEKWIYIDF